MQSICCQFKDRNKSLEPRMSTHSHKIVGPLNTDNLPYQADGYFMGYSNTAKVLIYYDTHTYRVNRSHHAKIKKYDIQIQPKEKFTPVSLLLHVYLNEQILERYNTWIIMELLDKNTPQSEFDKIYALILKVMSANKEELVKVNGYGAISDNNKTAYIFYII